MDAKRRSTLEAFFKTAKELRPIMTSLNGDNSWLMSFPRPKPEAIASGKVYFHIVFEPWLVGPTSQLAWWFIHLRLSAEPVLSNRQAVENLISEIEEAAKGFLPESTAAQISNEDLGKTTNVDAILLGFHYLDHCHEPTLRQFDKKTPVIATQEAKAAIEPWKHFENVSLIQHLGVGTPSWRDPTLHPDGFPSWLTSVKMLGHHELNYVHAIIWSHEATDGAEIHEAMLHSPHGTRMDEGPLQAFLDSEPPTQKLAMLHGFKESRAGGMKNTYGVQGGLDLYRRIGGAKYWLLSHHSPLLYSGIIMSLLWVNDTQRTLEWGLEDEEKRGITEEQKVGGKPNVIQVENGNCFVLE